MNAINPPPPHDLESEAAVLGALLLAADPRDTLAQVEGLLVADDFYRTSYHTLYCAIREVITRDGQADIVTVRALLEERGDLERVGGRDALRLAMEACAAPSNAAHYAGLVHDRAIERQILETCARVSREVRERDDYESPGSFAQRVAQDFGAIADRTVRQKARPWHELLQEALDLAMSSGVPGWSTSLASLHRVVPRFRAGELIVVAGRPGMGKSMLMRAITRDLAAEGQVIVMSLEEGDVRWASALLASEAGIPKSRLRDAVVGPEETDALYDAARALWNLQVTIEPEAQSTATGLVARARHYARRHKPTVAIVVDYLQLMRSGEAGTKNRHLELGEITRQLKLLALELKVPVFLGSQLRRPPLGASWKATRPNLSDLRDSGAIESDADVVLSVWQRWKADPGKPEWARDVVEVGVLKNRDGQSGGRALLIGDGSRLLEPSRHSVMADRVRRYERENG